MGEKPGDWGDQVIISKRFFLFILTQGNFDIIQKNDLEECFGSFSCWKVIFSQLYVNQMV